MKNEELEEVVEIIEGAFDNPNEPVSILLLKLRSNASYRKLVGITMFGGNDEKPRLPDAVPPILDIDQTAPPIETHRNLSRFAQLKKIGFWREARKPVGEMFHMIYGQGTIESSYPDVNDCIDPEWKRDHFKEYLQVTSYLAAGRIKDAYAGSSCCRICGMSNGSCDITDDIWVWPEGFLHYIIEHNVKPPQKFIDYIMEMK